MQGTDSRVLVPQEVTLLQLGQHVARVVGQPLGGRAVRLGSKADRSAHLDDHLGHARTHAGDQLVELRQTLAAFAIELEQGGQHRDFQSQMVPVGRHLDQIL